VWDARRTWTQGCLEFLLDTPHADAFRRGAVEVQDISDCSITQTRASDTFISSQQDARMRQRPRRGPALDSNPSNCTRSSGVNFTRYVCIVNVGIKAGQ
jgi:hypothetical protein